MGGLVIGRREVAEALVEALLVEPGEPSPQVATSRSLRPFQVPPLAASGCAGSGLDQVDGVASVCLEAQVSLVARVS